MLFNNNNAAVILNIINDNVKKLMQGEKNFVSGKQKWIKK